MIVTVRVLRNFFDTKANKERKKGDVFTVGQERAEQLLSSMSMGKPYCEILVAKPKK